MYRPAGPCMHGPERSRTCPAPGPARMRAGQVTRSRAFPEVVRVAYRMRGVSDAQGKSLWDRVVAWTIKIGEAILGPVERFIGKRSLVGDATFFPLERFPWVKHVEENWMVIREEAERLLEVQADLANFQDIS